MSTIPVYLYDWCAYNRCPAPSAGSAATLNIHNPAVLSHVTRSRDSFCILSLRSHGLPRGLVSEQVFIRLACCKTVIYFFVSMFSAYDSVLTGFKHNSRPNNRTASEMTCIVSSGALNSTHSLSWIYVECPFWYDVESGTVSFIWICACSCERR